jgi:DNA repair exonuclease SbcCD nuclease subunit
MLIIGDMHVGVKASLQMSLEIFHEYFARSLKSFFQYIDQNKIKNIVLLGDVFDVRKNMNLWAANWFIKHFRDECIRRDLHVYVIIGNHDIFYGQSIDVNSPLLMMGDHPDTFTLVQEPMEFNIEGMECLMVPWICRENEAAIMAAIRESQCDYLFGHFEFDGFEFNRGVPSKATLKHETFSKFKKIWSGHYHHGQMRDNVIYTGTPWELTWADWNDNKGVYEFKDHLFKFVANPYTLYSKIGYLENMPAREEEVKGKYVRVLVANRPDKKKFNKFLDEVWSMGPLDVRVDENYQDEKLTSEIVHNKIKTTIQVLHDYIDASDIELDKDRLKKVMGDLYSEVMMET